MAAAQPAASGGAISGAEIERLLAGKTIMFATPASGSIFTCFESGGAALVAFENKPGRVLNKTWKIGGDTGFRPRPATALIQSLADKEP